MISQGKSLKAILTASAIAAITSPIAATALNGKATIILHAKATARSAFLAKDEHKQDTSANPDQLLVQENRKPNQGNKQTQATTKKEEEECKDSKKMQAQSTFSGDQNKPITIAVRRVKNMAGRFAEEGRDANQNLIGFWKPAYEIRLAEILSTELANTGHFTVVERENLYEVLEEQSLKNTNQATVAKKCNLTGAKYIIIASLSDYIPNTAGSRESSDGRILMLNFGNDRTKVDTYVAFDLRVINTSTGAIAHSRTIEGTTSSTTKVDRFGLTFGGFGGGASENTQAEATPASRALRAAMISTVEYLNCHLYKKDSCITEFQALDTKRKESTKGTLNLF